MKTSLLDQDSLENFLRNSKIPAFRMKQIYQEVYHNQNIKFDDMTTLPKDLRQELDQNFEVLSLVPENILESEDSIKIGFKTYDGFLVESVLLFHWNKYQSKKLNRITLCISSQVGCPIHCVFCVTGKLGFKRNLTWNEIISQLLFANFLVKNKFGKKDDQTLWSVRNVVFMGMGEPLLNYENVKKSLLIMLAQQSGFSLSRRHITISTVGILPGIQQLIEDNISVKLAISLHAPCQKLREELIPIAKTYSLDQLMSILDHYVQVSNNRVFYEYVMIKDKTDTLELAKKLASLLQGKLAHVNLIPYNTNPTVQLQESSKKRICEFKNILEENGITVTIRDSLGRNLNSACGQLGYEKIKDI